MSLHPDFPIIEGRYRLTAEWELDLPERFNRRIEDGNMVIWRPGLTFWISVWGSLPEATPEGTLAWMLKDASPERTDEKIDRSGEVIRLSYRLREQGPAGGPQTFVSINGCVIAPAGLLVISAYCDNSATEITGGKVIGSVRLSDGEPAPSSPTAVGGVGRPPAVLPSRASEGRMTKVFKIPADRIRELAPGRGGCIASDRITVDGKPVGFMYRDDPEDEVDSGWRMVAGDESEAYMDDASKHEVYDVNTIANYDPDIIPLLDAPIGAAFERSEEGPFVPVDSEPPDEP